MNNEPKVVDSNEDNHINNTNDYEYHLTEGEKELIEHVEDVISKIKNKYSCPSDVSIWKIFDDLTDCEKMIVWSYSNVMDCYGIRG